MGYRVTIKFMRQYGRPNLALAGLLVLYFVTNDASNASAKGPLIVTRAWKQT